MRTTEEARMFPSSKVVVTKRRTNRNRSLIRPRSTTGFVVYKEACESISEFEQIQTGVNDRMERVTVLSNTWVWTTRCRFVRASCNGAGKINIMI